MEEVSNLIFIFILNALDRNLYSENLQWINKKQRIFRLIKQRSNNWKKNKEEMSQIYIDWAKVKDKLDETTTLRELRHRLLCAIKCKYHADKVTELPATEEKWRYFQLLKERGKLLRSTRKSNNTNRGKKKRKDEKNNRESKSVEPIFVERSSTTSSVEPIIEENSSTVSCNPVQNGEVDASESLPSVDTLLQVKSTFSSFPFEPNDTTVDLGYLPGYSNQQEFNTEYIQTTSTDDFSDEVPSISNLLDLIPDSKQNEVLFNPKSYYDLSQFEHDPFLIQTQAFQIPENFFEPTAESEQSLQQIPSEQSDLVSILREDSVDCLSFMIGFEKEEKF